MGPQRMAIPVAFQAAACKGLDVQGIVETANTLGAGGLNDMMVQIVAQIMAQHYPTPGAQNALILNVLAECAGAFAAPSVNSANTFCKEVWPGCVDKLAANIKADDKLPANILPAWLSRKVTTTDVASTQFELKAEAEAAASAK